MHACSLEVVYSSVLKTVLLCAASAPPGLCMAAMLEQLIRDHNTRAATRCVGVGVSGPIMLREPKDLFVVSFQNLGIGVYAFLEKLDVNKAVRD